MEDTVALALEESRDRVLVGVEVGVTEMVVEVEAQPLAVGDSVPEVELDAQALTVGVVLPVTLAVMDAVAQEDREGLPDMLPDLLPVPELLLQPVALVLGVRVME